MPPTATRTLEVRAHHDAGTFRSTVHDWFAADPVRHTMALSVMTRILGPAVDPAVAPVMVTAHEDGELLAAVIRTPPWPLLVSGLPADLAKPVATELAHLDPELSGVIGPRESAEAFAEAWSATTGVSVHEVMAGRLYELAGLRPPAVAGGMRLALDDDLPLLRGWLREFQREAVGHARGAHRIDEKLRRSLAMGDGLALWEVEGTAVAMASANVPVAGMSRVVSVYTPPGCRGHGYGSAITAAVTRWALDAGARHVALFTDLANPTSNSIYRKIGYRPVLDTCELEFR
jgi:predicted GNAT family acetyltransferase